VAVAFFALGALVLRPVAEPRRGGDPTPAIAAA
jgi:hypothetical protein